MSTQTFNPPEGAYKPVESKKAKKSGTMYVVLVRGDDGAWSYGEKVEAASADFAIRLYAADQPVPEGTYVAVPERSWQPRTLLVESKPRIRFE